MDLAGTTALVTGAGNPDGIGYATALRLGERGADVAVTDVTVTPGLEQLAAAIETLGAAACRWRSMLPNPTRSRPVLPTVPMSSAAPVVW